MIYKQRRIPKKLLGLLALEKRLPEHHKKLKVIQDMIYTQKAGFGGEQHFDNKIAEFSPAYPHAIVHDLCLKQNGVFFQMDSILITPTSIIIFEVKNIAGKLILSSQPTQFIRQLDNGERKGLTSPIAELDRKKFYLNEWLIAREVDIPISGVVTFSYSNEVSVENIGDAKISFAYEIPSYLRSLPMTQPILTKAEIQNVAKELIKHHDEYNPFPMAKMMGIKPIEINPGVICSKCKFVGMQWEASKWICFQCGNTEKEAHKDALKDWFMLINKRITNREFSYFTQLQNRNVARRLLAKSNLEMIGKQKGAYYVMRNKE